jgi:hypothetical protein
MAYSSIVKPSAYFNTKLFTGNGGTQAITGVGFQPDLTWIKCRDDTHNPNWFDAVRGVTKRISSHSTAAESTVANSLTSFNSDGFTLGASGGENSNSNTYVSWNWKAGNSAGSSNTDGNITSTVSANTTAGFSIVKYSGNLGSGGVSTVGHGLGVAPKAIIVKNTNNTGFWAVLHTGLTNWNYVLELNDTFNEVDKSGNGSMAAPTTTVFSTNYTNALNVSGRDYIAYCFAEKTGFSKFGKFTSNGSDNGTFTYTGFTPNWVMVKPLVSDGWSNWYIFDTTRKENLNDMPLYANLSTQEGYYGGSPASNYAQIDILSNGFKIRRDGNWGGGGSGTELIYMAFAEQPLVANSGTDGVPATAR